MSTEEMLQETHDAVIELKVLIKGANGDLGVIGEMREIKKSVADVCTRQTDIEGEHIKLEKKFWTLVGVLAGSGVLGVGIYELIVSL